MSKFNTRISHSQYEFHCNSCDAEYDSRLWDLVDIVETVSGRSYVFVCPFCGTQQKGDIIEMEIDYGRTDPTRRKRLYK